MDNNKPMRKYGEDELTFSLNVNDYKEQDREKLVQAGYPDAQPSDFKGYVVVGGQRYYMNGNQKKDTWIAGNLKKAPPKSESSPKAETPKTNVGNLDDEIPF